MYYLPFALLLAALPIASAAHEYKVGDLLIDHPVARATTQNAMTGVGYFSVTNNGTEADRLMAITADFPRVMMHDTEVTDGIASMFHIEGGVAIAPGETVVFAPAGKHVMFMGLNGDPFEIGEEIPAKFLFENAGAVDVMFNVEEIVGGHDH